MSYNDLAEDERQVVAKCLFAAVNGKYFPDWEFETLIGSTRHDVRKIAANWETEPLPSAATVEVVIAVLGNLVCYPHGMEAALSSAVGKSSSGIDEIRRKLSA